MIVAIYALVSTTDQSCEMQLHEVREYVSLRGSWLGSVCGVCGHRFSGAA